MKGKAVKKGIRVKRMPLKEIYELYTELCNALCCMHQMGYPHSRVSKFAENMYKWYEIESEAKQDKELKQLLKKKGAKK